MQAVPQPLLCHWEAILPRLARVPGSLAVGGILGCQRGPFLGDPPFQEQQGTPPAQGLAPGQGSHTTGLLPCQRCLNNAISG